MPRPSLPTNAGPRAGTRPSAPTIGGPPHFSLFGIPVRIGLGFWVMAVLFGAQGGMQWAVVWAVVVFVSVMIHELGHALVARAFGARPSITLHALGGLTYMNVQFSRAKNVLVSLAGPFSGFALGTAVWLATRSMALTATQERVVDMIEWVNIGWGVVNLLPVLPFDGGHVLQSILGPKRALATALISAAVGVTVVVLGLWKLHSIWIAFLFGSAAASAIGQVRIAWQASVDRREGLEDLLAKAKVALAEGRADDAYVLADDVVRRARTAAIRNAAWHSLAWSHVAKNEGRPAREALSHVEPRTAIDVYTLAAVEDCAGEARRAEEILEQARLSGLKSAEMSKLLIDLYARSGNLVAAAELAAEDDKLLAPDDLRAVARALYQSDVFKPSAMVSRKLFERDGRVDDALDEARALVRAGDRVAAIEVLERVLSPNRTGDSPFRTPEVLGLLQRDPVFLELASDERFTRIVGA